MKVDSGEMGVRVEHDDEIITRFLIPDWTSFQKALPTQRLNLRASKNDLKRKLSERYLNVN